MTHLGRRWTRTHQLSGRSEELEPPAQLVGQQLGLVVAPLTKARWMQRDGDHPAGRDTLDGQALGHQLR